MARTTARRGVILSVMCLTVFLVVVDNTIVNVALPSMSRTLHASNAGLQWIVDGYSLPFAGLLLAGGSLSDRFGRRRVMVFGLLAFGVFSSLAAFSTSTGALISARALMGAAAAFVFPATLSILTVTYEDPSARAKAFGIWGATSGLAVAFGPLTGGALITHFWFGSIFLINVPIVILTVAASLWLVPESRAPERRRFDGVGLVSGTTAVSVLVLAIIEGPSWGWLSPTIIVLFALAAGSLALFVRYESARVAPLLDVRVFSRPAFSAGAAAIAINFFGLFGFIFLMTQYFQLVRGYSAFSSGAHTLPFAIVSMVATPLGAIAALRFGARVVVSSGLVIMGLALAWVGELGVHAAYVGPVIGSMIVLAFGFSLITAPSTAAVMGSLSPDQIGAGAAVNNTTRELGGTLGVAVLGSIFSSRFAPAISTALHGVGVSGPLLTAARSSMAAALSVVDALPVALRASGRAHVVAAFLSGFHAGCLAAAGVLIVAAVPIGLFLPGRSEQHAPTSLLSMAH